jgi:hypothetical protein
LIFEVFVIIMKKKDIAKKQVGIYLSGLGGAFTHESVERYASRFSREYDYHNPEPSAEYQLHIDRFEFDKQKQSISNRVGVIEKLHGRSKTVYQFYELEYAATLTRAFKSNNALVKIMQLFVKVFMKMGPMILRLFYLQNDIGYCRKFRGQTLYLFFMIFVVSMGITFLIPAAVVAMFDLLKHITWLNKYVIKHQVVFADITSTAQIIANLTALLIFFIPGFSESVIGVSCEFVSAGDYLERGLTKQTIHGQLDLLIEQIVEHEGSDCEICFHSYSFGSLIIMDYLFPFGNEPSERVKNHVKGMVTIGCPYDFIAVYFPRFFRNRNLSLNKHFKWINVYSLADALGSNFRKTNDVGMANYSFQPNGPCPINIDYEVANTDINLITQFFTFAALRAHGNYWDGNGNGQSCLRMLIGTMKDKQML